MQPVVKPYPVWPKHWRKNVNRGKVGCQIIASYLPYDWELLSHQQLMAVIHIECAKAAKRFFAAVFLLSSQKIYRHCVIPHVYHSQKISPIQWCAYRHGLLRSTMQMYNLCKLTFSGNQHRHKPKVMLRKYKNML